MKKLTLALATLTFISSCREEEYIPTDTFLDLELSCSSPKDSPNKKIIFKVDQIIPVRNVGDSIIYDSIPRSSKEVLLNLEKPESVWLGTYYIEKAGIVNHLELLIKDMTIQNDTGYVTYKIPSNWWIGVRDFNTNLNPTNIEPTQIKLDLTQSQTLDSANQHWIKPVFN